MAKVNVKQVNVHSVIDEIMDTETVFKINGWSGLVSELIEPADAITDPFVVAGTVVFFPGVTFKQLNKK